MENLNFTFSAYNEFCSQGITEALNNMNNQNNLPVIVCIGSDLVLGDSLGPLVGTLLKKRNIRAYIYGNLNYPITAKEVDYAKTYIKEMHKKSFIIAIDAAVGDDDDIGLIKTSKKGIKPGLGAGKNLSIIGDASIIGIVASRSIKNHNLYNLTRLNLVYKLAEKIADGIEQYIESYNKKISA